MCHTKTYNLFAQGFFATFGLFMVILAVSFKEYGSHELSYLNQIANDWEVTPFVSIQVTMDTFCPPGQEEVIYKPWYGTKEYCVCNHMLYWNHYKGICRRDNNDSDESCMQFDALSPVMQA